MSQPHHRDPRFIRWGRLVRDAANADPNTRCWRCGRRLTDHPPHKTGAAPTWHAGHTIDGQLGRPWLKVTEPPPEGPWLAAEASTCNVTAGARAGARGRGTGYSWP